MNIFRIQIIIIHTSWSIDIHIQPEKFIIHDFSPNFSASRGASGRLGVISYDGPSKKNTASPELTFHTLHPDNSYDNEELIKKRHSLPHHVTFQKTSNHGLLISTSNGKYSHN